MFIGVNVYTNIHNFRHLPVQTKVQLVIEEAILEKKKSLLAML